MAIIKCPECNEKISSTVDQCVHCGAKIIACPECETAFVKGAKVCTECGYEFEKAHPTVDLKDQSTDEGNKKINANHLDTGMVEKGSVYLLVLLTGLASLVTIGFLFWIFTKLLDWNKTPANMLLTAKDLHSDCMTLLTFAMIFIVVGAILDVAEKKARVQQYVNKARENKTTLPQIIENTLSIDYSKKSRDYADDQSQNLRDIINADIYERSVDAKNRFMSCSVFKIVLSVVISVCLYFFIQHNIEVFMTAELFKSDMLNIPGWSWERIEEWWLLVVVCVAVIIIKVLDKTIEISEKKRSEWIKKEFPDGYETYDKHLDGDSWLTRMDEEINEMAASDTRGGI